MQTRVIDGVAYVNAADDGEPEDWQRLPGDPSAPASGERALSLPEDKRVRNARRGLRERWVTFEDPATGEEVSPDELERALRIVAAHASVTRDEYGDDYADARHAGLADEALAVMVLTPKPLRRALGMPETYAEFDREWGFTEPYAAGRRKQASFERDHIRSGTATARARGELADRLISSLARKLDNDEDTSGHANLAAKLAGLVGDTEKDKFEGTARGGAVERSTPEEMAGRWVGKLMATKAWALLARSAPGADLRTITEAGLTELFGGGSSSVGEQGALPEPAVTVHAASGYEPPPWRRSSEEAQVVGVR